MEQYYSTATSSFLADTEEHNRLGNGSVKRCTTKKHGGDSKRLLDNLQGAKKRL